MLRYLFLASIFAGGCVADLDATDHHEEYDVNAIAKKGGHGKKKTPPPSTVGEPCGGDEFIKCGPSEFCHYADPEPAMCGVLGDMGVCAERPTSCPDVFEPACACNGYNYGSECEANMAGSGIWYNEECW